MTDPSRIRRLLEEANPVPDPTAAHDNESAADVLFSAINGRRGVMPTAPTRKPVKPVPPPKRPWYRQPVTIFASAVIVTILAVTPLLLLRSTGSVVVVDEPVVSTTLTPVVSTTIQAAPATTTTIPTESSVARGGGYTWSELSLAGDAFVSDESEILSVTHVGSHFVAVGRVFNDCAQVWVSSDRVGWDSAASTPEGGVAVPCRGVIRDVASNGVLSVAVGEKDGSPALWTSEDGYSWDIVWGNPPFASVDEIQTIAASEGGFVAAGSAIWFSPDGREWIRSSAPLVEGIADVAVGPSGFLAVGSLPETIDIFDGQQWGLANAVLQSPDGRTWSVIAELSGRSTEGTECWIAGGAVTYGPSGYVIAGDCVSEESTVAYSSMWTSDDGLRWTQVAHDEEAFLEPAHITSMSADENGYLAAGWSLVGSKDRATVWFSQDARSWTRTELPPHRGTYGIRDVTVHEGTAVAVGHLDFQSAIWLGTGR
jgi:hypothetical protein